MRLIQKCDKCHKSIFWATHERTGKPGPLCRPPEGTAANINVTSGTNGEPIYSIVSPGVGEFISHYADCPFANEFRRLRRPAAGR